MAEQALALLRWLFRKVARLVGLGNVRMHRLGWFCDFL